MPQIAARPAKAGPFVVVGDVFVDIVVRIEAPVARDSDTPARTRLLGGGSAANVAAWLAAAGAEVSLVGRIGDDVLGRSQAAELAALGVDARLAVDPALPTGTCVVLVDADGRRTMFPDPGASEVRTSDLPGDLFRPAEPGGSRGRSGHLHLPGYALLRERSRAAGLRAIELARTAGMTVSVDASSAAPLAAVGAGRFLGWIRGADVLFANEDEATVLTGERDMEKAARSLADAMGGAAQGCVGKRGAKLTGVAPGVVVKLGAGGALWTDGSGELLRVAAEPCDIVDTTGAGDAFAAGFLAAWTGELGVEAALRAGATCAARAISVPGARPPHRPGAIDVC